MRTHVVIEQTKLELIEGGGGLLRDFLETNPDENGTGDMIALDRCQATLTALNPRGLLGFTVNLLNLPAQGTHVLGILRRILSDPVGGDP